MRHVVPKAQGCRGFLHGLRFAILVLWLSGCAVVQQQSDIEIENELRADQPESALALLDQYMRRGADRALYSLNKAMILRQAGDFEGSVAAFEKAKASIGVLDPISISESIAAYTISEQLRSYQATTYEKLFVHLYQIMNFLALGQLESARVEVMQIDIALSSLRESGQYQAAAAARYLSGIVFEALGEKDNALISYRQAYENYEDGGLFVPLDLQQRLLHLTHALSLKDEQALWERRFGTSHSLAMRKGTGELIMLFDVDFAPYKEAINQTVVDPGSRNIIHISLPHYQTRNLGGIYFEAELDKKKLRSEALVNIEAVAVNDLQKHMPKLTLRAISRNITRNVISDEVREENQILGDLLNIAGTLFDNADIRSWRTLPNRIHIVSVALDPGVYAFEIAVRDSAGNRLETHYFDQVEIKAEQITLLNYHWIEPLFRVPLNRRYE